MPRRTRVTGLTAAEVEERYSLRPDTLRRYERLGLVCSGASGRGQPRYSEAEVERLEFVLTLTRELRVNLAGTEVALHMRDQILGLQTEIARLTAFIGQLGHPIENSTEALVPAPPKRVVHLRER